MQLLAGDARAQMLARRMSWGAVFPAALQERQRQESPRPRSLARGRGTSWCSSGERRLPNSHGHASSSGALASLRRRASRRQPQQLAFKVRLTFAARSPALERNLARAADRSADWRRRCCARSARTGSGNVAFAYLPTTRALRRSPMTRTRRSSSPSPSLRLSRMRRERGRELPGNDRDDAGRALENASCFRSPCASTNTRRS